MKQLVLTALLLVLLTGYGWAGELDLGLRYGRVVEADAGGCELVLRYVPAKVPGFTGTFGCSRLHCDQGGYCKDADVAPSGRLWQSASAFASDRPW